MLYRAWIGVVFSVTTVTMATTEAVTVSYNLRHVAKIHATIGCYFDETIISEKRTWREKKLTHSLKN